MHLPIGRQPHHSAKSWPVDWRIQSAQQYVEGIGSSRFFYRQIATSGTSPHRSWGTGRRPFLRRTGFPPARSPAVPVSLSARPTSAGNSDCGVWLKRVFGLVIDFGTSQSPKSTRPLTTYWCPSRPGHQALHNNFASSLLLRTCLPMTGRRVRMPTLLPLWRYAHDG